MLTRRAFLGSAAALAACDRSPLEVDDMALQKTVIPIKFTGLDTSKDPKTGATGRVQLLENAWASRDTDGGIEVRKWPGTAALAKNIIETGTTLAAGERVGTFRDELVMLDGRYLYGYNGHTGSEWSRKGAATALSSVTNPLDADTVSYIPPIVDAAYASGTAVIVSFAGTTTTTYYVLDSASGAVVGRGTLTTASGLPRARVVAVGSTFFLFYYKDNTTGIVCVSMSATGAPTFSNEHTVVADASLAASHLYDVAVDTTNSRMLLVYANAASGLGLQLWTTSMTAGASANYNTRNPNLCLGILHHDWSNSRAYVGIGTTATGIRLLSFNSTTLANVTDVVADGTVATGVTNITGFFDGSNATMFYEQTGSGSLLQNELTYVWDGASNTPEVLIRSVGLGSKVFKIGTAYYFAVSYESTTQKHLYLVEYETARGSAAASRYSYAGHLRNGDAGGLLGGPSGFSTSIGSPAIIASDHAWLAYSSWQNKTAPGVNEAWFAQYHDLRFNGSLLGAPVAFNNELHIPGAIPKVYDGRTLCEEGWLVLPEAPTLAQSAGGSLTALGTYRFTVVWKRRDSSGNIVRSAPSPSTAITLTAGNQTVTVTVPSLRITAIGTGFGCTDVLFGLGGTSDARISVEVYVTTSGGTGSHLVAETQSNDVATDSASLSVSSTDVNIAAGEELYTDTGEVENSAPAEVLAYATHRDRLFALSGDGALYFTKESAGGLASAFSDADGFFLDFDQSDGAFTGIVSDGTTLFVSKRSRIYLVSGDGPSLDGNNSYGFPQPLPSEVGFVSPRGFVGTPDGIIFKSAKGFHLLDRGGGIQIVPAPDAYDSLTVNGGVVLDDRTLAYFVTAEGRTLAWDWVLKQWYTTSPGRQSAVAVTRWQNQCVYLKTDGTVVKEVTTSFADDGVGYTMAIDLAWLNLTRCRIYKALVIGEVAGNCTLSMSTAYDFDAGTLSTPKTIALTTASKAPWAYPPSRQWAQAIYLHLEVSGTTEGLRLSEIDLEVGIKQGAVKIAAGKTLT